jgi:hypothetical protein
MIRGPVFLYPGSRGLEKSLDAESARSIGEINLEKIRVNQLSGLSRRKPVLH